MRVGLRRVSAVGGDTGERPADGELVHFAGVFVGQPDPPSTVRQVRAISIASRTLFSLPRLICSGLTPPASLLDAGARIREGFLEAVAGCAHSPPDDPVPRLVEASERA
jgi:hypothetical protein